MIDFHQSYMSILSLIRRGYSYHSILFFRFLFKTISQEKSFLSIHLPYPVEGLFIYLLLSIITYSTQGPKTHLPYLLIPSSKTISKRLNMLFLCSFKGVFPPSTDSIASLFTTLLIHYLQNTSLYFPSFLVLTLPLFVCVCIFF